MSKPHLKLVVFEILVCYTQLMDKIEEVLTRGVANIIPGKEALEEKLRSDKTLNIYLGIDPTATHIHLGHAVALRKIQAFAELGHHVTFLIGDFTALIGDTSDKEGERPVLSKDEIQENFQTYKNQAEKILDFSKVEVKYNSEWLSDLSFEEIIRLTQHFSVGDFVGRELIRRRLDENKRVGLHELLYPVMQGYDSYMMDTDIQIGGTDQTFNMQAGRTLQKDLRDKETFVLATGFLTGTDGRKMSKTWNNAIWLDDTASDIFAKTMAINDDLIVEYFTLATNVPMEEVRRIEEEIKNNTHPLDVKKRLAQQIVSELFDNQIADKAAEEFQHTVQEKNLPSEMETRTLPEKKERSIEDILVDLGIVESKSEGKRLVEQGGVSINDRRVTDPNELISLQNDDHIKVGKRRIVKIQVN